MAILITVVSILLLVVLISSCKVHVFVSFLLVSVFAGLLLHIPAAKIVTAIQKGMGETLGAIVGIIALGAMLGKLVAQSGAAECISNTLIRLFGTKRLRWAFLVTGFLVGLPLFYSVGFILLAPIAITVAHKSRVPATYLGLPLLTSLSVTQGFLPPHPAPLVLVQQLHANMGLTLWYGILISIPAILLGGMLFGRTVRNIDTPPNKLFIAQPLAKEDMPSATVSFVTVLLPVVLIGVCTLLENMIPPASFLHPAVQFIGEPVISMLVALLVAVYLLGIRRGKNIAEVTAALSNSIKDVAMLFLVFGGAGALKQILVEGGVSDVIGASMAASSLHPYILGWMMAAFIRVSVGSSTVAGITTAGFFVPVVQATGVDPNLMVLSIGAGSMMFAHVNDTGFWLFKEYFQLSLKDIIRSFSLMETIISITGLAGVMTLKYLLAG